MRADAPRFSSIRWYRRRGPPSTHLHGRTANREWFWVSRERSMRTCMVSSESPRRELSIGDGLRSGCFDLREKEWL